MSKVKMTPNRGEIWDVDFDPRQGAEIGKKRPAVVISEDAIGRLPLRIVVPITEWDARYAGYPWFVRIAPTSTNGLSKESGADAFQVKSISEKRFVRRRGALTAAQLDDIAAAIAICVGVPQEQDLTHLDGVFRRSRMPPEGDTPTRCKPGPAPCSQGGAVL